MLQENLEAITICVQYADILNETARHNKHIFDEFLVVTTPDDRDTRNVCKKYNLRTLLTNDGQNKGNFHKGRMIERGLQHLSRDGFRCHIDADIVLPSNTRHLLEIAELQKDTVYGIDRVMIKSYADWKKVEASGWIQNSLDNHYRVHFPKGFEIGARWAAHHFGYVPIGFFQLWHSNEDLWGGVRNKPYPRRHNDACRTDVQHGLQWDRPKRAMIPELICLHLESQAAKLGANWAGRKTVHFGPPLNFGGTGCPS